MLHPHVAQWTIQALVRGAGTLATIMGLNIIIGGAERWSSRSYATALQVPGAPASWGVVLAVFGLLAISATFAGRAKLVAISMYLLAAWALFFSLAFGKTALEDAHASSGGFWAYLGIAFGSIVLGAAYWQSSKGPHGA